MQIYFTSGVTLSHVQESYTQLSVQDRRVLEELIGDKLPDGIEARFELYPAGTGAWQLDDEYRLQLRLAHSLREKQKTSCIDLIERNRRLRILFDDETLQYLLN